MSEEKRGHGRPPKKETERLSDQMVIRFTAKELEKVQEAANVAETPPASWARTVLLRAAKRLLGKLGVW